MGSHCGSKYKTPFIINTGALTLALMFWSRVHICIHCCQPVFVYSYIFISAFMCYPPVEAVNEFKSNVETWDESNPTKPQKSENSGC